MNAFIITWIHVEIRFLRYLPFHLTHRYYQPQLVFAAVVPLRFGWHVVDLPASFLAFLPIIANNDFHHLHVPIKIMMEE